MCYPNPTNKEAFFVDVRGPRRVSKKDRSRAKGTFQDNVFVNSANRRENETSKFYLTIDPGSLHRDPAGLEMTGTITISNVPPSQGFGGRARG